VVLAKELGWACQQWCPNTTKSDEENVHVPCLQHCAAFPTNSSLVEKRFENLTMKQADQLKST